MDEQEESDAAFVTERTLRIVEQARGLGLHALADLATQSGDRAELLEAVTMDVARACRIDREQARFAAMAGMLASMVVHEHARLRSHEAAHAID